MYGKYILGMFTSVGVGCVRRFARSLVIPICCVAFVVVATPAFSQASRESCEQYPRLQNRIQQTKTLINNSSVATRISEGTNEDAKVLLASARDFVTKADLAAQAQLCADAQAYLAQAIQIVLAATRQLRDVPDASLAEEKRIENRIVSTRALLGALERVHRERSAQDPNHLTLLATINTLIESAVSSLRKHEHTEASRYVDQAYLLAKTSIINLRNGDTLVRSLHFQNKSEEYLYELDRNDTHLMLYALFAQQGVSSGDASVIARQVAQARELRVAAERLFIKKDFEAAINNLEQSTDLLKRSIRASGVYIP